jgi:lipid A 3-O-deacylase PagL
MKIGRFFVLVLMLQLFVVHSQQKKREFVLGFAYGFGNELKNTNYTYSNHFYKAQLNCVLKTTPSLTYEIVLQPEVNFGSHQLLNKYFIQPHETDYEAKRERFMKQKKIREYILNIGVVVRVPFSKSFSMYVLGSVGPMITDTETERLSKGFAFSDVIALGFSLQAGKLNFDVRPSLRHVSNGGFQSSNAGFNTANLEFGIGFPL